MTGCMTCGKGRAMSDTRTGIVMKEPSPRGKLMGKVFILGQMVKYMMENGKLESRKDMESGKESVGTLILASGEDRKLMDMEFILGKMETGLKESGEIVLSMDRELTFLLMETVTQEVTVSESLMAKDSTSGAMDLSILESLGKD